MQTNKTRANERCWRHLISNSGLIGDKTKIEFPLGFPAGLCVSRTFHRIHGFPGDSEAPTTPINHMVCMCILTRFPIISNSERIQWAWLVRISFVPCVFGCSLWRWTMSLNGRLITSRSICSVTSQRTCRSVVFPHMVKTLARGRSVDSTCGLWWIDNS